MMTFTVPAGGVMLNGVLEPLLFTVVETEPAGVKPPPTVKLSVPATPALAPGAPKVVAALPLKLLLAV